MRRLIARAALVLAVAAGCWAGPVAAQFPGVRRVPGQAVPAPVNRRDPVAFTADQVQYDRDNALVTATGQVEAWQNDHVLRADKITFDRNTNIAAASGHVVMIEPDGQVLFSDYAELTEGMREGVLQGMRAVLAENGKLAANGVRRVEGKVNEMTRAVYTTCDLCKTDPTKPPLWQMRARTAVQDSENKRIEYRDAVVDIFGIPVIVLPYFWHADPSVKRASGFLVPSFGQSDHLGAFLTTPYYQVLDDQSDLTLLPTFSTQSYINLGTQYRRRFNDGTLLVNGGVGYDQGKPQGEIFARGRFAYDETWRYGFDLNRASSAQYLRDYRVSNRGDVLTSSAYVEGFGTGAYTRLDAYAFQGLVDSIKQARLPYVLPRYQYSFFGEPDALGGRFSLDTQSFNIFRSTGTNTRRLGATAMWERPFAGLLGERYKLTFQTMAAGYSASSLTDFPNYYTRPTAEVARAQPQAALEVRWPLVRDGGSLGTQIVEPIAQVIVGPNSGGNRKQQVPNEDSLDFEFTDQNLFALNRYPGIDRFEGGARANVGLHANWRIGGAYADALVGQSYRSHLDDTYPPLSGVDKRVSDIVTRTTLSPVPWFDLTGRTRLDKSRFTPRFIDAQGSVGSPLLRVSGGFLYSQTTPYSLYDQATIPNSYFQHRKEVTVGVNSQFDHYRFSGYARRDLQTSKMTSVGVHAAYEDECFIFDVNFNRRYTSLNGDTGASIFLFQITFKTVGQFGFHAF